MNISEITTGTHRSDLLRNANVADAQAAGTSSGEKAASETDQKSDRVEISDDARSALADARKSEDLAFARKALDHVPELSNERTAAIKERIKNGFYNRPDVLASIAQRIATDLNGSV